MTQNEIIRLYVIQSAVEGKCTVRQAADRLTLSTRRIKQLKKEFTLQGASAIIHGNANRSSPKKLQDALVQEIVEIYNRDFTDCNFTHFQEILSTCFGIEIAYTSLHRLLKANGIKSPKSRRKKRKVHKTRERRPAEGMLLQADATPFAWFGGEEKFSLHGFIDDATGKVTGAYLCKNECLLGYLEVLRQTLTNFGIPQALYPDRHSVFFVNSKKEDDLSIEEQLTGINKKTTQFGRIIDRLGIDMFPAHSPQAKGRVERLWNTLQSRLPVELRMAGISTCKEANSFLLEYLPQFNRKFGAEPKESFSAFVPVPSSCDLDRLLSVELTRSLSRGSTVSISNKTFLIEQDAFLAGTKVTILLSEKYGLRALINGAFYPVRCLDDLTNKTQGPIRTGEIPRVVLELLHAYLLKESKAG